MNSKEFLEFTKGFVPDKDGFIEIYRNDETDVSMRITVPDMNSGWKDNNTGEIINYSIYITEVGRQKLGYGSRIYTGDDLKHLFFEWLDNSNEIERHSDEYWDYYDNFEEIADIENQEDITNMIFKDSIMTKFYNENKDKYCFYCKVLPLKNKYHMDCGNTDEYWHWEKHQEISEIIEIYENLVSNKI